jgi:endoribonuclease Dicer
MIQGVKTPLRSYQSRICDKIQNSNALVVLPTGAGKTLVAAELVCQVHARRAAKQSQGRTLFLMPTVMLVEQQAKALEYETSLTVQRYYGALKPLTAPCDVLVSTPVAYMELLDERPGLFDIHKYDLVVFDEVRSCSRTLHLCSRCQLKYFPWCMLCLLMCWAFI